MTDQTVKWAVLIAPDTGAGVAHPVGPFESEAAAWEWVGEQPALKDRQVHVLRLQNPV